MSGLRLLTAKWLRLLADRISSTCDADAGPNHTDLVGTQTGPASSNHISNDIEAAAGARVLKILSEQLLRTAEDMQRSVLKVSTGFTGMAQQAREAVQLSQCRIQSQEGLNRVLDSAGQTLSQVDIIAKEARIVGLNGQIEAARAGEQGVAFSVVANETKSLAHHAAATSGSLRKMLTELSDLHQGLVTALQGSETASQALTGEISNAVVGLQFQDRVQQQIEHVVETLNALHNSMSPRTRTLAATKVDARLNEWRQWMDSRSTMESQRYGVAASGGYGDTGCCTSGSVELF